MNRRLKDDCLVEPLTYDRRLGRYLTLADRRQQAQDEAVAGLAFIALFALVSISSIAVLCRVLFF